MKDKSSYVYLHSLRFTLTAILMMVLSPVFSQVKTGMPDSVFRLSADSLDFPQASLDSLRKSFQNKADSITALQQQAIGKLTAEKAKLKYAIDSLHALKRPAGKYIQKNDSIEQCIANTTHKYETKLTELKSSYTSKIRELKLPPEASAQVDKLNQVINKFELPSTDVPSLNVPELNLPDVKAPDLNLNNMQVNNLKIPDTDLPTVDGMNVAQQKITEAIPGTDQLNGVKEIASVNDIDGASRLAEQKVADIDGVKNLTEKTGELEKLSSLKDEDAAKNMLKEQVIDHFAGKEEVLEKTMEELSKLKSKYSSIKSLADIAKKRPNEMRDKPFVERLRPGLCLQFYKSYEDMMADLNPYLGYRLTGRLTSGFGWNQRVVFDPNEYRFTSGSSAYGPRLFTEYNLWRGFHPRLEMEMMRTTIPPVMFTSKTDVRDREWVWGMMFGLKKQYKIAKGVNGTAMVMFKLFDRRHKSPYKEVVNMRVGVEFNLKRKRK